MFVLKEGDDYWHHHTDKGQAFWGPRQGALEIPSHEDAKGVQWLYGTYGRPAIRGRMQRATIEEAT